MIFDTHCHLDLMKSQGFDLDEVVKNCQDHSINKVTQIGIDLNSSILGIELSKSYSSNNFDIFFSLGSHPNSSEPESDIERIINLSKSELSNTKFVAIGEIGLDYYRSSEDDEKTSQIKKFETFLQLASDLKKPVIIHSRDADADTYSIVKNFSNNASGIIHCYTYDYESAKKYIDLGYKISFSGILTYKNANPIHEAAKNIPLSSILIETDAPFLSPHPFRGKKNSPENIKYILEHLFSLRTEKNTVVEEQVYSNSLNIFQL